MRRVALSTLVLVSVVVVSGCSTSEGGKPIATSGATASSGVTTSTDNHGAPRVAVPLDGTSFLSTPCAVLTDTQLETLNLPKPGRPDTDSALARSAGPSCLWQNSDTPSTIGFGFLSGNKNGLSDTYRGRERFEGYFEPTEVDGYPAVFDDTSDFRADGSCNITVGISDTLAFRAAEDGPLGVKSCDRAKQVASMVIQTIRSGA
jgi:hypothetical protein